jgi:hypothetical protein
MDAWQGFEAGKFLWLLANTPSERTWVVRKAVVQVTSDDSENVDGCPVDKHNPNPLASDTLGQDPNRHHLGRKHQRVR